MDKLLYFFLSIPLERKFPQYCSPGPFKIVNPALIKYITALGAQVSRENPRLRKHEEKIIEVINMPLYDMITSYYFMTITTIIINKVKIVKNDKPLLV